MKAVEIAWQPDAERFVAVGSHEQRIHVNAPHLEAGDPWTGFGPTELLLAAAGTCAAWDVVDILRKQRQAVDGIDVRVTGDQATEAPWHFTEVTLHFTIRGRGLRCELAERAVHLSEERYCSVTATIRGVARVGFDLTLVESGPAPADGGSPAERVAAG